MKQRKLRVLFALLAACVVGSGLGPNPAPTLAQGGGVPVLRFEVTFRLAGQPAPAGSEIIVLTARSATDTFECARGTIRDGGMTTIEVPPAQRCADQGNAGGPVSFFFTYVGERVGSFNTHIDLSRPAPLGQTVRVTLAASANPARPTSGPPLVVARFHGALRLDGQPAPAGTPVRAITARSATDTFDCGSGATIDGGFYSIDVPPEERCADNGNAGGPTSFVFLTGNQRVGAFNTHLDLNRPASLGDTTLVTLAGRREAPTLEPATTATTAPPDTSNSGQPRPPEATPGPRPPLRGGVVFNEAGPLSGGVSALDPSLALAGPLTVRAICLLVGEACIDTGAVETPVAPPLGLCTIALGAVCVGVALSLGGDTPVEIEPDEDQRRPCWLRPLPGIPQIRLPLSRYPETGGHVEGAQIAGWPSILTLDRDDPAVVNRRRAQATSPLPSRSDLDRDEYPMAATAEGGTGASVMYVSPADNRGAGSYVARQWNRPRLSDGTAIEVCVTP